MKILNILSSINAQNSNSRKLVEAINNQILSKYPDAAITTRDLTKKSVPHLEAAHYSAFQSGRDVFSDEDEAAIFYSDTAIDELNSADIIVIAVPMYNFSIPDTLKSWIDQIVRSGVTFTYETGMPVGLLSGKKVYLAVASGAVYSDGPMKNFDFAEPYLRTVLGFIGLTDITAFRIEGTKMPGVMETALPKAVKTISEHAF